ncbi:MAG TPA: hypothetical protein VFI47_11485 [Acidimicrobiales bacterium]|nr:hypothetical protein [Acidimicrobiales bacterium]
MSALVLTLGLLAAGCGGGGGGDEGGDVATVSDDDGEEQAQGDDADPDAELLDWVECMRDEGIAISDPTRDADGNLQIDGPGIHIGTGPADGGAGSEEPPEEGGEDEEDLDPEAMKAATESCGPPPMGGGGREMSEEDRQKMEADALEFAQCMRDEGIEDFPDPDFSGSGPGGAPEGFDSSDEGPNDGGPGSGDKRIVGGPFGEIDMDDPEMVAAFEACQEKLGTFGPPDGGKAGDGEGADT